MILPIQRPDIPRPLIKLVSLRPCAHAHGIRVSKKRSTREIKRVCPWGIGNGKNGLADSGHGARAEVVVFLGLLGRAGGGVGRGAEVGVCGVGCFRGVHDGGFGSGRVYCRRCSRGMTDGATIQFGLGGKQSLWCIGAVNEGRRCARRPSQGIEARAVGEDGDQISLKGEACCLYAVLKEVSHGMMPSR